MGVADFPTVLEKAVPALHREGRLSFLVIYCAYNMDVHKQMHVYPGSEVCSPEHVHV